MSDDRQVLLKALEFHGHRCWASVAGVRAGLAALRELRVARSGGRQLHGFVEIGEDHGGMCFGDGVQYATGCTLGKGNLEKTPYGKLPEIMGFVPCAACGELTARAYLRVLGEKHLCIPCSGYER